MNCRSATLFEPTGVRNGLSGEGANPGEGRRVAEASGAVDVACGLERRGRECGEGRVRGLRWGYLQDSPLMSSERQLMVALGLNDSPLMSGED